MGVMVEPTVGYYGSKQCIVEGNKSNGHVCECQKERVRGPQQNEVR